MARIWETWKLHTEKPLDQIQIFPVVMLTVKLQSQATALLKLFCIIYIYFFVTDISLCGSLGLDCLAKEILNKIPTG